MQAHMFAFGLVCSEEQMHVRFSLMQTVLSLCCGIHQGTWVETSCTIAGAQQGSCELLIRTGACVSSVTSATGTRFMSILR